VTLLIHLIRHAESTSNIASMIGGIDAVLTDRGIEQAERLGDFLATRGVLLDEVQCSPYVRTVHTASVVCKRIGYDTGKIHYDRRLIEIVHRDWEGKPLSEVWSDEERNRAESLGMDYRTPNGESMNEVGGRMFNWAYDQTVAPGKGEDRSMAVFTHGHAIRCLMHRLFGIAPDRVRQVRVDNTSITTIRHDPLAGWSLDCLNTVPHLS
jgi:broad specificity phosphatase PhoE